MNKFTKFLSIFALAGTLAYGQYVTVNTNISNPLAAVTTITGALTPAITTVCLTSATSVVLPSLGSALPGSLLLLNRETMQVVGAGPTSLCFRVRRGVLGTGAQSHAVNSSIWVANPTTSSGDTSRPIAAGSFFPLEDASPQHLNGPQPAFGTTPSSAVPVAGSVYWSEITVEHNRPVTGICVLNGSVIGTDNHIFALYDYAGNLLGQSASTLAASASLYQCLPFVTPIEISGLRSYFIAVQSNGTTATIQKYITGQVGLTYQAGSQTGTFATLPNPLPIPATFTTATGPIGALY